MPKTRDASSSADSASFIDAFGEPARGFLAPAWQRGHVRLDNVKTLGLDHVLGFFSLESHDRPAGAAGDLDVGLRSLGLARTRRPWDRMAVAVAGSRRPDAGDSPQRSGTEVSGRRSCGLTEGAHRQPATNRAPSATDCSRQPRVVKAIFDAVMERRARQLMEQVRAWLPAEGPVLDLGSGTGHLSARLEQDLGLEVVAADVSDIHVVGPPPVLIADGVLPFEDGSHTAALLVFMLAYPKQPGQCSGGSGTRHARAHHRRAVASLRTALVTRGCASGSSSGPSWRSTRRSSSATSLRRRPSP